MSQEVIHVYFVPGMAAKSSIFENIHLPEDQFKMHLLEWIAPTRNESLESYAKRMCTKIVHDNVVLIGVSFGGIMVQEMSKYVNAIKVVIISSVKTRSELPRRMKVMKSIGAYRLIPKNFVADVNKIAKYAFGKTASQRVDLYKKFMYISDPYYLSWAIEKVVCWKQDKPLPNIIHIHGDKDGVFPFSYIKNSITVEGGTHIMVINRYKWMNEHLPKLILS